MRVVTGETVSSALLAFGYSEVAVTILMLSLLSEGDTMVDVGTHFGYEALLGSHLVGSTGQVICFEPSPRAFAIASQNLGHLKQVSLHKVAIADSVGQASLQNRSIGQSALNSLVEAGTEQDSVEVPITTLDAALAGRKRPVNFLKCDAEGSELAVLKGAHDILVRDSPVMVLEADMPSIKGEPSARACELVNYLENYNYRAFSFDFDQGLKVGRFGSFPTYHANVAFVPSARVPNGTSESVTHESPVSVL